jgi:glycosyltransferase A (GT-A) superfamily protein (DUF2064 family)
MRVMAKIWCIYYRCPGICSPLMEGIAEAIDRTDLVLGRGRLPGAYNKF